MVSAYASIDPEIEAWAQENGLALFTSFAEREARYCYTSTPRGECFQVSIEPPCEGAVAVHVWSIEMLEDEEIEKHWSAPPEGLRAALDAAMAQIARWAMR